MLGKARSPLARSSTCLEPLISFIKKVAQNAWSQKTCWRILQTKQIKLHCSVLLPPPFSRQETPDQSQEKCGQLSMMLLLCRPPYIKDIKSVGPTLEWLDQEALRPFQMTMSLGSHMPVRLWPW